MKTISDDMLIMRISILIKYLNNHVILEKEDRFSDYAEIKDNALVRSWIHNLSRKEYYDFVVNKSIDFKDAYPLGYERFISIINGKSKEMLYRERLKLIMVYVKKFGIPNKKDRIKFCKLGGDERDTALATKWYTNQKLMEHVERFLKELENFSSEFPVEYKAILNDVYASFVKIDSQVISFMKYLNDIDNSFLAQKDKTKFCDIDELNKDQSVVGTWYMIQRSKEKLSLFVELINKYKDNYPLAYERIVENLNDSRKLIERERQSLVNVLSFKLKRDLDKKI